MAEDHNVHYISMSSEELNDKIVARIAAQRERAGEPNDTAPTAAEMQAAFEWVAQDEAARQHDTGETGEEQPSEDGEFPAGFQGFQEHRHDDGSATGVPIADLREAIDAITDGHSRFHADADYHNLRMAELGKVFNETEIARPTSYADRWTAQVPVAKLCDRVIALVSYHEGRIGWWGEQQVETNKRFAQLGVEIRENMVSNGARYDAVVDQELARRASECAAKIANHQVERDNLRVWSDMLSSMSHDGDSLLPMTRRDFSHFAIPHEVEDQFVLGMGEDVVDAGEESAE